MFHSGFEKTAKYYKRIGAGAGALGGAAVGALFGDEKEDRIKNALLGAAGGASLGTLAGHGIHRARYREARKMYKDLLKQVRAKKVRRESSLKKAFDAATKKYTEMHTRASSKKGSRRAHVRKADMAKADQWYKDRVAKITKAQGSVKKYRDRSAASAKSEVMKKYPWV